MEVFACAASLDEIICLVFAKPHKTITDRLRCFFVLKVVRENKKEELYNKKYMNDVFNFGVSTSDT